MKKTVVTALVLALSVSAPAMAAGANLADEPLPVAYGTLARGDTVAAIERLERHPGVAANDPSRLINLGAAYARIGHYAKSVQMYRAAMDSDIRYEVELPGGRFEDSRAVAKAGLERINMAMASR
jgi:Tfp pilus assembly protein PilF